MNIRIGNDICIYVNLLGNKNLDAVNINSIEAFLINTSKWQDLMDEQYRESALMQDEFNCRRDRIKFVSRFPVEPCFPGFHPTPYDVCCTGHPCYHQHPIPYIPIYHGYGVHPHTFERGCFGPCAWHTNHPHHLHEPHTWACDDMHDVIDRAGVKYMDMQRQYDRCRFLAPVEATDNKNKIKVYFPAQAQIYTGTYKLVVVAKVYEPGYCKDNLRTITIDYENVFTLVNSSDQGCDGNVTIRVGTNKFYSEEIRQIRLASDNYTVVIGNELKLGQADYTGQIYKLIIDLKDGSSIEYNPGDWEFGAIVFESMKPREVNINQTTGKITGLDISNIEDLPVIKVYNNQHDEMASFTVKVVDKGYDYIVFMNTKEAGDDTSTFDITDVNKVHDFINAENREQLKDQNNWCLYEYENIFGTRFVSNPKDDNYMWIVSREKIADSNSTSSPIKTSMFDVPLYNWGSKERPEIYKYNPVDHMYYHLCPNPLVATNEFSGYDITVEPK